MKHIKNAPMISNLQDVIKSALYMVASLLAFAVKLTVAIITGVIAGIKGFAAAVAK